MVEVRSSPRLAASVDKSKKHAKLEQEQCTVEKLLETVQENMENNNDIDTPSLLPADSETVDNVEVKVPVQEANLNVCENSYSPQPASSNRMDIIIDDNVKWLEHSADKENNNRLPLKKRFRSSVFSDITNNINNSCNNQFSKPSKIDQIQYIDQIDFDDLDAILSLAHMKHLYWFILNLERTRTLYIQIMF